MNERANETFWQLAEENPSHIAVVEPDGRAVTAGELLAGANRLVHALRARGLRRGDTVAVALSNQAALLEIFMAAAQAGFYFTPINSHLAAAEIAYILGDCEARAFFFCAATAEASRRAVESIDYPRAAVFVTDEVPGFESAEQLKAGQPASAPPDRRAGLTMMYTSGTTGRPKGVRRALPDLPPEPVAASLGAFLGLFGIAPRGGGVHLVVSPLYHTAVLNFATNHMHVGHTVVLMDKWTPESTLERIQRHRVTATHMVPTQFRRLLALDEATRRRYDVSSLRHVIHSAAPCPIDVKRRMLDWWGPCIFEYYAASEGGGT